jgi:hypothetical protein
VWPPETFRPPANATREQRRRHDAQMREWLVDQLDRQNIALLERAASDEALREFEMRAGMRAPDEQFAIDQASRGNIGPLRKVYPKLSLFLQPPQLGRGQKYPRPKKIDPVIAQAADHTRRIKALWAAQYGTKRRWRHEKSAEDFAIAILSDVHRRGIRVHAVEAALKKSGKHKRPRLKHRQPRCA